jgi:hypothetical protein
MTTGLARILLKRYNLFRIRYFGTLTLADICIFRRPPTCALHIQLSDRVFRKHLIRAMWHNGGSDFNAVDNLLRSVKRFIDSNESPQQGGENHESSRRSIFRPGLFEKSSPFYLSLSLFPFPFTRFIHRNSSSESSDSAGFARPLCLEPPPTIDHDHPCTGICWGKWLSVRACNRTGLRNDLGLRCQVVNLTTRRETTRKIDVTINSNSNSVEFFPSSVLFIFV